MVLTAGTRMGAYEIVHAIGAGGMGEVYRARDSKLNRDVAIKILPELFGLDPDRLARFDREAQTLAALNHTNIAQIFAVLENPAALVMELVDGDDLSAMISRGPMPIADALRIARQIAEALEAAHELGIVHRDLKPANIKVRSDGAVKVLDFGLAKAMDPSIAPGADAMHSPTFTSPAHMTQMGVILGTAAYMAPEQARGKAVDKRADIWAFGVILYEMLTGHRGFTGDTITDVLAAVVMREPDWTALPADTPPSVRRLLSRCLEKDARRRLRDIGDARMDIDETIARRGDEGKGESTPSLPRPADTRPGRMLLWAAAGAAVAVMGMAGVVSSGIWPREGSSEAKPLRLSIFHSDGSEVGAPAISPDGRRVAFRARRADGMPLLWVRDLASDEAQALPGTEDASLPFWSPDSRDLGFFAGAALKRVAAAGGPVRVVVEYVGSFGGYGGAWAANGTIAYSGTASTGLSRVSADGGATTVLTKPPTEDWAHFWPSFLPDGRRFLFTAKLWTRAAEASEQGIYLGSLDNPSVQKLLPDLSSAVYAPPGYLVFSREGRLMAAPFDLSAGRVTGTPLPIGGTVATDGSMYFTAVSASADGTLAVRPPPAAALVSAVNNTPTSELHVVDRHGTDIRLSAARLFSYFMALNPVDSRMLAVAILDLRAGTQDLALMDLTKDTMIPLKTTQGFTGNPVWSADGKRLAYTYQPPGGLDDVYVKDMATGSAQPIIETPRTLEHAAAWSHDQKSLLIYTDDKTGSHLASWSFAARTLTRFVGPRALEGAAFSLHDDLVAFTSQESGRPEVYVTTFPDHRQTWPLTTEGGRVLGWSNDGREILVATVSGHVVAYPVSTDGGFSHGQPTTLVRNVGIMANYSAAYADHSRILIRVSPDGAKDKGEMRLLFGWQSALRQGKP